MVIVSIVVPQMKPDFKFIVFFKLLLDQKLSKNDIMSVVNMQFPQFMHLNGEVIWEIPLSHI